MSIVTNEFSMKMLNYDIAYFSMKNNRLLQNKVAQCVVFIAPYSQHCKMNAVNKHFAVVAYNFRR